MIPQIWYVLSVLKGEPRDFKWQLIPGDEFAQFQKQHPKLAERAYKAYLVPDEAYK